MSGISKKQARILKKQIKKLYGRSFVPVLSPDGTHSIGDVLERRNDGSIYVDSSVFDPNLVQVVEGKRISRNITSSSSVSVSTKINGEAELPELFKLEEAGIAIDFNSENQFFLKLINSRQQSMKNFVEYKKALIMKYTRQELSSKVYIIRGVVYADQYVFQFSSAKEGSIGLNIKANDKSESILVDGKFGVKWRNKVGFDLTGLEGGVLAYRVSAVRLKREHVSDNMHMSILDGNTEAEYLDSLSLKDRAYLEKADALEIVDATEEFSNEFLA